MEKNITVKVQEAMNTLERIADSYGVARASYIAILADRLIELGKEVSALQNEVTELREYKEEHGEHDDKSNEVSAES